MPSVAAIVASLHGRTGKTLLARMLADYFIAVGQASGRWCSIPTPPSGCCTVRSPTTRSWSISTEVRDQMTLFDTLAARSPEARVVDVSHHVFRKFFKVMQESQFVAEARARQVEPVIFYIADRNPDAYEEGAAAARALRGLRAGAGRERVSRQGEGSDAPQRRLSRVRGRMICA